MTGDLEPPGIVPADHYPHRGDWVDGWLRRQREMHPPGSESWAALDDALDEYRERADTGTPLSVAYFARDGRRP